MHTKTVVQEFDTPLNKPWTFIKVVMKYLWIEKGSELIDQDYDNISRVNIEKPTYIIRR